MSSRVIASELGFKIKFLYQNLILIIIYIFISLIFFTRSKYTSKNFKIWKYKKF